jgi:hypothetical protein
MLQSPVYAPSCNHQSSRDLTVSCHGAFFLNWFFCRRIFYLCVLQLFFLLQSQSHVFLHLFFFLCCNYITLRVLSLRDKVAITHMLGLATVFFAIVEHQWLQPHCNLLSNQPYFSPGCNHIKQTLTTSCISFFLFRNTRKRQLRTTHAPMLAMTLL